MKFISTRFGVAAFALSMMLCGPTLVHAEDEQGLETLWIQNPKILACTPKDLTKGGTLSLHLGEGHGLELAIRRVSDNAWFFLVSSMPFDGMQPLMNSIKFDGATEVDIKMNQRGYERPENPNGLIFTTSGEYDVYTSNALESEEGGYKCVLTYRAK